MKKVDIHEQHPPDRLGRIAARMTETLEADHEHGDERAIVILTEPHVGGDCMTLTHGYEQGDEGFLDAFGDLYQHLQALAAARGMDLQLMPIARVGQG